MSDTGLAMQRAQDKIAQMQARAGAMDELLASGALTDLSGSERPDPGRARQGRAGRARSSRARPAEGPGRRRRARPARPSTAATTAEVDAPSDAETVPEDEGKSAAADPFTLGTPSQ